MSEQLEDNPSCIEHIQNSPLENWSKWQTEWQNVQKNLATKLNLDRGDLLMNASEGLRAVKEEKQLLEYAKIPTEFDKYRGKPDFYKLPYSLPERFKHCRCYEEPSYFAVKTKQESYIVPSIEIVGTPDVIKNEKNVLDNARDMYKKWQQGKYRQEQMEKWHDKIKNIVPQWPQVEHLVVLGKSMFCEEEEEIQETVEKTEDDTAEKTEVVETLSDRIGLKTASKILVKPLPDLRITINDIIFDFSTKEGNKQFTLHFMHDIDVKDVSVQYLPLENNGTTTLRLYWTRIEKYYLFSDQTTNDLDQGVFYFDRRELLLLPGQTFELPVYVRTRNRGNFIEEWELTTIPQMWNNNFHLVLHLHCVSFCGTIQHYMNLISNDIERKAKHLLVKDLVHELTENALYKETPVETCIYGKTELFEMANIANEQPLYIFNEEIVQHLQELYEQLKTNSDIWNYDVTILNKLAHKADTQTYLENKSTELQEKIKRIEDEQAALNQLLLKAELKKNKKNKKEKGKKKKKGKSSSKTSSKSSKKSKKKKGKKEKKVEDVPVIVEKVPEENYVYVNIVQLRNFLKDLDSPVIRNLEREKYFACYVNMLGSFNKMSHLLYELETTEERMYETVIPNVKNKLVPIQDQPERIVYEYFENHYIPQTSSSEVYFYENKPRKQILNDIVEGDIEALYTAYFNKSPWPPKPTNKREKKKKGKGHKKEKSKSPSSDKKKKEKSKSPSSDKKKKGKKGKKKGGKSPDPKTKVVEDVKIFDPFAENFIYQPDNQIEEVVSKGDPKVRSEHFKYKEYIIIYTCLQNAVDGLVDTLNSFKCVLPPSTRKIINTQLSNKN